MDINKSVGFLRGVALLYYIEPRTHNPFRCTIPT
jgi:hypothetical protein